MGVCFPPSLTKQSDRFQRSHQAFYWAAPGRYSVSGRFWASVRQDASSGDSAPGFFGVVLVEASPVTLDVVQPEPAATSEASEGAESKGGDGREAPRAESAAPDVPPPKDLPQERAVSTRDHAALQGSWTLESIDGKQVENGRTIKFEKDTVTGLFLDEEKAPRVLRFRLLAEDAVKGINVGPQLAPNKDDGFKMLGIYELESDTLKLAFLPKLDARHPPPGLDRERRPRSFDPKLVQIWAFRKATAPEEPQGNAGTATTKR
jgi:uncharacterized protein (TIGR03067 family)